MVHQRPARAVPGDHSHFNPVFYLIDGFRYGFIGHVGRLECGSASAMTAVLTVALGLGCMGLFVTGYKMKT